MFRELVAENAQIARAGSNLLERVMRESEILTGDTAALSKTNTAALSLPLTGGTTKYGILEGPTKEDLISRSIKRVGSDLFSVSEYTRLARAEKLDATAIPRFANLDSMHEVRNLVSLSIARQGGAENVLGRLSGDRPALSEAGMRTYASDAHLKSIVQAVSDGIKEHRWSTVIGDDASGRVPSLMTWDSMQRWAHHSRSEAPSMYFLAGGLPGLGEGFSEQARLANLTRRLEAEGLNSHSGRALIVTEIVGSGNTLNQFGKALQAHRIPYDVATMYSQHSTETLKSAGILSPDAQMFTGSGYGRMYFGTAGNPAKYRQALGIEKYGAEATTRPNLTDPLAVAQLRRELVPLGQHIFERTFQ